MNCFLEREVLFSKDCRGSPHADATRTAIHQTFRNQL